MKTKSNKLLVFIIIAIAFVLINISVVYIKISDFQRQFTGQALGYMNLTIVNTVSVSLTREIINWSSGRINDGERNATLYTSGNNTGIVLRGNWSGENAKGLIVQNNGNINCSLSVLTEKESHDFFNSSSNSNEQYMINVSNKKSGSCSGAQVGQWVNANKTSSVIYCNQLDFHSNNNEIYIDVLVTIPADSNKVGNQSDIITITASAAS